MGNEGELARPVRRFDLDQARHRRSGRAPAEHQTKALAALHSWYATPAAQGTRRGTVLSLPTGAGKTFSAVRFLCEGPLTEGRKILWLAHTHHLLEQAFDTFGAEPSSTATGYEVGHIGGSRRTLTTRVVSGGPGHCRPRHIEAKDDVLIATLQTLYNAEYRQQEDWRAFLRSARKTGLVVVFDEAHHAPANTYRALIEAILKTVPQCHLLGLTATPDYADPKRSGWLRELFPQEVIYRADARKLIEDGILSLPRFLPCETHFEPQVATGAFRELRTRFGDLPDDVIDLVAKNDSRNAFIAKHWLDHRESYGPTIIFTDRWVQCEAIRVHLERGGARVGAVYHHTMPVAEGGQARAANENARTLDAFRNGELDVIINIRMLTEGTDVPKTRTVFLTRQTTSRILLTQMIGRALRGPKFGGTKEANIVSFIDDWAEAVPWAEWEFPDGGTETELNEARRQRLLKLVSVELVRAFVRAIEREPAATGSFLSWIPVGWYEVTYVARMEESEDDESTSRFVMVFEGEEPAFERLLRELDATTIQRFEAPELDPTRASSLAAAFVTTYFPSGHRPGKTPAGDIAHLLRHVAQGNPAPVFHRFDRRDAHDLDAHASRFVLDDLGPRRIAEEAQREFARDDRDWRTLFEQYATFKSALDAAINRAVSTPRGPTATPVATRSLSAGVGPGDRELPEATINAVLCRFPRCLACGNEHTLQIDHVRAWYNRGGSEEGNLQTLCRRCNLRKQIDEIDFRQRVSASKPVKSWSADATQWFPSEEVAAWERYVLRELNFFYRCAATKGLQIGKRETLLPKWKIEVHPGISPKACDVVLRAIVARLDDRASDGVISPEGITVTNGDEEFVFTPRRQKSRGALQSSGEAPRGILGLRSKGRSRR